MKNRKKLPCLGALWVFEAVTAGLGGLAEPLRDDWSEAAAKAAPVVERLPTLRELKKLPTFALSKVAEAAMKEPHTRRNARIAAGLKTELERRRAKAATPDRRFA